MKTIIEFSKSIYSRIGLQEYSEEKKYIPSIYIITEEIEGNILIYNTLTREMILLESDNEYVNNIRYLVRHWFLFDDSINPYSICFIVKKIYQQETRKRTIDKLRNYTIMTTTNCNARCEYCYEIGTRHQDMKESTATDVAKFIKRTNNGSVNIQWFGGEPLCNSRAIDVISKSLKNEGILYSSGITSNGYLFHEHSIEKIRELWHLERVQITLDGTEEVYNKSKNFIYSGNGSPYKKVMNNLEFLAMSGISVSIRLNLSKDNIKNIHSLLERLHSKFGHFKNVSVYSRPLVNVCNQLSETDENEIKDNYIAVEKQITNMGMRKTFPLSTVHNSYCIADNMKSVVITPEGNVGLCEHYSESELIGDIYHDIFDYTTISKWHELLDIPECKVCPIFPQCFIIKKCPMGNCTKQRRIHLDFRIRDAMRNAYKKFTENAATGEK